MSFSIYHTHTHSLGRMSERGEELSSARERTRFGDHIFCFQVLLLPLVLILSLTKLAGFLLYGFPEENSLCILTLVFIVVHVILLDKILRSYCLNDKNITFGGLLISTTIRYLVGQGPNNNIVSTTFNF